MIVGIDLNSRKLAMCGVRDGQMLLRTFEVNKKIMDRAEICGQLYDYAKRWLTFADVVYIESPVVAGARNIQSTIKCAAAYGAVLAAVNATRGVVVEVPVSLWKLHTTGKGNMSKSGVSGWLSTTHPHEYRECSGDQDLIDATCIALYGVKQERHIDRGHVLPQAENKKAAGHRSGRN